MKFLFDLFPVLLFFIIYSWAGSSPDLAGAAASKLLSGLVSGGHITTAMVPILLATTIAVVASVAQLIYMLVRRRRIDTMLWFSFGTILIFGSATIYLQNETFIKWKPTVLHWFFGASLLLSHLALKKNLIRTMLEKQIELPDAIWSRLNLAWAAFFGLMGVLNLYVAFSFPTEIWVKFKLFGATGLIFVFAIAQSLFLSKYVKDPQ